MNSSVRDSVQFLEPDGRDDLFPIYPNIMQNSPNFSNETNTKNNIAFCIEKHQITILAREYCIRSLELPQYLEKLGWCRKGIIAVVEQKHETEIKKFAASDIQLDFGNINYITNEELLKELFLDPLLSNYGIIIVHDVHSRNVLTDTALALLKKILRKRSTLKLILGCNTRDANIFVEYFNRQNCHNKQQRLICTVLSVDDLQIKHSIFYLKSPCADYIKQSVETIRNIHQKYPLDGDIIVYLVDDDEINGAIELLKNYINMDHIKNINYFKFSNLNKERGCIIFPKTSGKRNVIFTQELDQDSVIQDQINYVIDCGFIQMNWFQADTNKTHKVIVPVSKCEAETRSNWGNKYRKVYIFRLYTKNDFDDLPETSVAKMRRTNVCSVILYLKTLAVDNILRFDFPSPPPAKNVLAALETLYALGALDDKGELTDPVGFFMSDIPFSPHLSKALFNSIEFQCSEEILTIVVMMQVDLPFISTTNHTAYNHKQVAKRTFEAAEGDLITLLNIYTAFIGNDKSKEFCRKYFLNYRGLIWAHNMRNYFAKLLINKYKISLKSCLGNVEQILKCIISSYFMNVAYLHDSGVYKGLRCKSDLYIDRDSSIYCQTQPKYVTYCELYDKNKTYMSKVSVIKEEWLTEIAPHYYELK